MKGSRNTREGRRALAFQLGRRESQIQSSADFIPLRNVEENGVRSLQTMKCFAVPMWSRLGSEFSLSPNSTTDRSIMYAEMSCNFPQGVAPGKIDLGHRLAPVIECPKSTRVSPEIFSGLVEPVLTT